MIKYFITLFLLLFGLSSNAIEAKSASPSKLIINETGTNSLPRNFRTMAQASDNAAMAGLEKLPLSGSGQFCSKELKTLMKKLPKKKIIVLDLRQESHGFLNGEAISWHADKNWANKQLTDAEVEKDQRRKLRALTEQDFTTTYEKKSNKALVIPVTSVSDEKTLVESLGAKYKRFFVTDHVRPNDATVDQFVMLIRTLPKDYWIHLHCKAGKGRTTTFLAIADMIHNSKKMSCDKILERQHSLGGSALMKSPGRSSWKYSLHKERLALLKNFYQYCQEVPDFSIKWSNWVLLHPNTHKF